MVDGELHFVETEVHFGSHLHMHRDARNETSNGNGDGRNWYISFQVLQDLVSENKLAEASLKDENRNRLRHHVQHVLLELKLLLNHLFSMSLEILLFCFP